MRNKVLKATIYLNYARIRDFAQAVGENPSLVSRVLAGQEPGNERKRKYAENLGVSVEVIFPEEASR